MRVLGITLPEITKEWLEDHCRITCFPPHENIDLFLHSWPPKQDINKGDKYCLSNFPLPEDWRAKTECRISGHMIYPPGGYMSWHTNSGTPGTRLYAAWSENGESGMLFVDQSGKPRVDFDKPGWNIRTFVCPTWHAVFSKCWRVSIGWHLEDRNNEVENLVHLA
jgi:hypothetical protein